MTTSSRGQVGTPVPTKGIVFLLRVACRGGSLRPPALRSSPTCGGIVGAFCERPRANAVRPYGFYRPRCVSVGEGLCALPPCGHRLPVAASSRSATTSSVICFANATFPSRGRLSRSLRGIGAHKRTVPLCHVSLVIYRDCITFAVDDARIINSVGHR